MGRSIYGGLGDSGKKRKGTVAENWVTFECVHPILSVPKTATCL